MNDRTGAETQYAFDDRSTGYSGFPGFENNGLGQWLMPVLIR
jgi:hypothetical protein